MRVIGVDFGSARIGLAVGETDAGLATPKGNLSASGKLARDAVAIAAFATKEEADAIVLGLPLDGEGLPTKMSGVIEQLGQRLAELGQIVYKVDESLTSFESNQAMLDTGLKASQRSARVDSEAACRILERFFDTWSEE